MDGPPAVTDATYSLWVVAEQPIAGAANKDIYPGASLTQDMSAYQAFTLPD